MEIVPAIEIKGNVSLWQTAARSTQPQLKTTDPLRIAARWKDEGAPRIHLVDVDGTRIGMPQNRDTIRDLVRRVGLPVSLSGGVQNADVAARIFTMGVDRIIIPYRSITEADLLEMLRKYPSKIAVEVKAVNGKWVHGDRPETGMSVKAYAMKLKTYGVRLIVLHAVDSQDNPIPMPPEVAAELVPLPFLSVIIRSLIRTPLEIEQMQAAGVESVILGKALYDGTISLKGK